MGTSRSTEEPAVVDRAVALIEAVLFASPEPVTREEFSEALADLPGEVLDPGLDALEQRLSASDRGLALQKIAGGHRLVTRDELAEPLRRLFRFRNRKRLTPASLDVLSIVAYAQPITAPEIQEIRGTDPAYALRVLQERRMIRVAGRKRVVGRPMLFATTRDFLVHFGLDSLADLPPVEAYGTKVLPAQKRLFPVDAPGAEADPLLELFDEEGGEVVATDVAPLDEPGARPESSSLVLASSGSPAGEPLDT